MYFTNEQEFEKAIVNGLQEYGWKGFVDPKNLTKNCDAILNNVTEEQLIRNWKDILSENNKDVLNGIDLSDDEMEQVLNEVRKCNTFVDSNILITGEFIGIKRTNELDQKKYGKQVHLRIFYRHDINAGNNVYQIARQVTTNTISGQKRADLMLLFNGMPLIHIELKNTNNGIEKAINQIKNYSRLGFYRGIFKLVQVVVAMKPNEMIYMPNFNSYKEIVEDKFLKWTDFDNKPVNNWLELVRQFLSIPTAHRMISDYTIADSSDNNLKILRSYQVHAVNKIQDKFFKKEFFQQKTAQSVKGGYVWHTTGSGKTLTSFKLATLLLEWNQADIILFVVDRIELGLQTKNAFKKFNSSSKIDVVEATSTNDLVKQLTTESIKQKLIITSIHKQSRVREENYYKELNKISQKRIVFIFDEAHRTTFGEMYKNITENISNSVLFGFTGTPIRKENAKNDLTTEQNFGQELHKYTMEHGINDGKVLSFNCEYRYIDKVLLPFICVKENYLNNQNDNHKLASEKLNKLKNSFHNQDEQILKFEKDLFSLINNQKQNQMKQEIVKDILDQWKNKSVDKSFSAILATSSIKDAIEYFDIFDQEVQKRAFDLKFSALFDRSTDITEESDDVSKGLGKLESIKKIITRYNKDFNTNFNIQNPNDHNNFKEDVQKRLAQKDPYINLQDEKKLDLLIVVNQLLTGYDSKYINTVYFDKVLEYEHLIQAISRTNRTIKSDKKPNGNVIFFRQPTLMRWNMDEALRLYAGIDPSMAEPKSLDLFCARIDSSFNEIKEIFRMWGYAEFESVPDEEKISEDDAKKLLHEYKELRKNLNSAKILNFNWKKDQEKISMTKDQFQLISTRIKEIDFSKFDNLSVNSGELDLLVELADVDNSSWFIYVDDNYIKSLVLRILDIDEKLLKSESKDLIAEREQLKNTLFKEVYKFPKEYQRYAEIGVHLSISKNLPYTDFSLWEYVRKKVNEENDQKIKDFAIEMNLDENELKKIINSDDIINANGRLDNLCNGKFTQQVKQVLSDKFNTPLFKVKPFKFRNYVQEFIQEQRIKAKKIK